MPLPGGSGPCGKDVDPPRPVLEGPFTEESLCEFSRNAQALTNKDKDFLRPGQQVDRLARGSSVSPFIQEPEPSTNNPALPACMPAVHRAVHVLLDMSGIQPQIAYLAAHPRFHGAWLAQRAAEC